MQQLNQQIQRSKVSYRQGFYAALNGDSYTSNPYYKEVDKVRWLCAFLEASELMDGAVYGR